MRTQTKRSDLNEMQAPLKDVEIVVYHHSRKQTAGHDRHCWLINHSFRVEGEKKNVVCYLKKKIKM